MKKLVPATLFFFFLSSACLAGGIKKPAVAGAFYPGSAKTLAETINQFLDRVQIKKQDRKILALISPHAGYDYSGSVAAYGYKAVKERPLRTVIIIGPSHYEYFEGISVYPQGAWQTPLGNIDIDAELADALIQQHAQISFFEPAFTREHSLEVQLPFLQIILDNFKIVPIAMGRLSYEDCRILANALLEVTEGRDDILIVASTDMSHDYPYAQAREMDITTIEELKKLNGESLYSKLVSGECELCGGAAVITALLYAKDRGSDEVEILKYANSGDITGNKQGRIVGYLSAAIYRRGQMDKENIDRLNQRQKKRLLEIARKTVDAYVSSGEKLEFSEDDQLLLKHMGAFVTIHKQGKLRGCIGNIIGRQPLYLTVRDMAIQASSGDLRFIPVSVEELKDIDIEISVLTEPKKVESADEIEMGTHGVIVKRGNVSGVFLPQVATETGWTREEFLSNLCERKARLDPLAWKDKNTELYKFSAQVFGEKHE